MNEQAHSKTMDREAATDRHIANAIRGLAMDSVQKANSGHQGMPMGMDDVATVLLSRFHKIDPADPHRPEEQTSAYRRAVLGEAPRIGMTGFGASAPEPDLYHHFGITSDAVVETARD